MKSRFVPKPRMNGAGSNFLHYIVGMFVLIIMATLLRSDRQSDVQALNWMQSGGIYWHMVDLLWVFLFPMIYLLGAL
ncbi:hypothetical protein BH10PSE12_BH10PSE12_12690 [soil metagenome]